MSMHTMCAKLYACTCIHIIGATCIIISLLSHIPKPMNLECSSLARRTLLEEAILRARRSESRSFGHLYIHSEAFLARLVCSSLARRSLLKKRVTTTSRSLVSLHVTSVFHPCSCLDNRTNRACSRTWGALLGRRCLALRDHSSSTDLCPSIFRYYYSYDVQDYKITLYVSKDIYVCMM